MMHQAEKRIWLKVALIAAISLLAIGVTPLIGATSIDLAKALRHSGDIQSSMDASILFVTRLPRTVLGALTGAALAVAGVVFQALLRNPLATPYTLGVSSGGAVGAVFAIKLGLDITIFGFSTIPIFSLIGGGVTIFLVYMLARSKNRLPTSILLLAGVAISFFYSALILFAHYLADFTESHKMLRWMMGGLDVIDYSSILSLLPLWLAGLLWVGFRARDLDQLAFGGLVAHSRGVDVTRSQKSLYIASSLLVSSVVCVAGPIGFVGLIVPHSIRFILGPSHTPLLIASAFAGAGFLVLCDAAARTMLAPMELPIGVLTALIGGPFFIGLLFREKKRRGFEE